MASRRAAVFSWGAIARLSACVGVFLSMIAMQAACALGQEAPATPNLDAVGCYYFAPAGPEPEKVPFKLYSHIYYAFVTPDPQGRIADVEVHEAKLKRLKTLALPSNTAVLISLGGGRCKGFAALVKDNEACGRYVDGLVRLLRESACDGLDLDWEFPSTAEEGALFSTLTAKLRAAVDAEAARAKRKLFLTAAVNGNDWGARWISDEAANQYDLLNVMAYDMAGWQGGLAGHHSPLFASPEDPAGVSCERTMAYWAVGRGYPVGKLALGMPAYARGFDNAKPYAVIATSPDIRKWELGWNGVSALVSAKGWRERIDPAGKAPWFFSQDGKSFCCCDTPESVKEKTRWAKASGYRGVFFWAMGHDMMPDGSFPLSDAAKKAISGKVF